MYPTDDTSRCCDGTIVRLAYDCRPTASNPQAMASVTPTGTRPRSGRAKRHGRGRRRDVGWFEARRSGGFERQTIDESCQYDGRAVGIWHRDEQEPILDAIGAIDVDELPVTTAGLEGQ